MNGFWNRIRCQAVVDGEWKLDATDGDDCFVWLSHAFPGINKLQVAQSNITYITDRGPRR